jgi:UDP-N-acetylglucosamine 2-epimerase (non-hydrolysing)
MKALKKKILVVVGTRPNFVKITRFKEVAAKHSGMEVKIVHTGQHYDMDMADVFFEQFNLVPDFFLNIANGTANSLMAQIMIKLEDLMLNQFKPDLLVVVGDVNSTLAAALVANNLKIKLAHVESGLRSFDRTMPEEINRILTDELAELFFVTEESGIRNLVKEGKKIENIFLVGNTMIDTLAAFSSQVNGSGIMQELGIEKGKFVLMTIHRPATADFEEGLLKLINLIENISSRYKIIFPIHPRTVNNLKKFGLYDRLLSNKQLIIQKPLGYFAFQNLVRNCAFILTDSGGIQEESTWVGVPCITLRPSTERPVTCTEGTNTLLPFDLELIGNTIAKIENGTYRKGIVPPMWDGKTTERIFDIISERI